MRDRPRNAQHGVRARHGGPGRPRGRQLFGHRQEDQAPRRRVTGMLARYERLVSAGELQADPDQRIRSRHLDRLQKDLEADELRLVLLASCSSRRRSARERLHVGRRRSRQVDADGPVRRDAGDRRETPRAFPRVHARGRPADARPADQRSRRSDRQGRARYRRRCALPRLRRDGGEQHRRCGDHGAAVHRADPRRGRDRGHHQQPPAARSLQGRAQPLALPALHRPCRRRNGCAPAQWPDRLPARPAGRYRDVARPVGREGDRAGARGLFRLTDYAPEDAAHVPSAELELGGGRTIHVPKSLKGVGVFSFKRLCGENRGERIIWRSRMPITP